MNEYFKLAWRNIWRNKRRTIITAGSIFFGVVLSAFMSSMQEGSYAQYIKTIVNFYSGYIQIHKNGYWNEKIINNTFKYSSINSILTKDSRITSYTPRLENYALASSEEISKGVMVFGILPQKEDSITGLSKRIITGKYLVNSDSGIIVGSELAKLMKLRVKDTLVLLSQGYHGVSAAGKYPVRGILKQPSPELDRTVIYMDIAKCQELFSADDRLTAMVIMVKNNSEVKAVKSQLAISLGNEYEVMDWQEMNKILMKQIDSDRASGIIIKGVLYMIIAFGIFSTIMMMTIERRKEFAILIAVGMQKYKLGYVLVLETILLGLVGVTAGIILSIPLTWYFTFHPILLTGQAADTMRQMGFEPVMAFSMIPSVYFNQALTILIFTLVIGIYPVYQIFKLKINQALHN